jgi:hypothetical protein
MFIHKEPYASELDNKIWFMHHKVKDINQNELATKNELNDIEGRLTEMIQTVEAGGDTGTFAKNSDLYPNDTRIRLGNNESTNLELGPNTFSLSFNGGLTFLQMPKLAHPITPIDQNDLVPKKYVDDQIAKIDTGDALMKSEVFPDENHTILGPIPFFHDGQYFDIMNVSGFTNMIIGDLMMFISRSNFNLYHARGSFNDECRTQFGPMNFDLNFNDLSVYADRAINKLYIEGTTYTFDSNRLTFNQIPKLLDTLTEFDEYDLVPRKYVDEQIGAIEIGEGTNLGSYYKKTDIQTENGIVVSNYNPKFASIANSSIPTELPANVVRIGSSPDSWTTMENSAIYIGNGGGYTGLRAISIGNYASDKHRYANSDSIVIGYNSTTAIDSNGKSDCIVIGNNSAADNTGIILGNNSKITDTNFANAIVIGDSAWVSSLNGIAIGTNSKSNGASNGSNSIAIGTNSESSRDNGIAIGNEATCYKEGGVAIGTNTIIRFDNGIAIGSYAESAHENAIVIGNGTSEHHLMHSNDNSIVLGNTNITTLQIGPNEFTLDSEGLTFNQIPKLLDTLTEFGPNDLVPKSYVDSVAGGGGDALLKSEVFPDDENVILGPITMKKSGSDTIYLESNTNMRSIFIGPLAIYASGSLLTINNLSSTKIANVEIGPSSFSLASTGITFGQIPKISSSPAEFGPNDLVPKSYVDSAVGSGGSSGSSGDTLMKSEVFPDENSIMLTNPSGTVNTMLLGPFRFDLANTNFSLIREDYNYGNFNDTRIGPIRFYHNDTSLKLQYDNVDIRDFQVGLLHFSTDDYGNLDFTNYNDSTGTKIARFGHIRFITDFENENNKLTISSVNGDINNF